MAFEDKVTVQTGKMDRDGRDIGTIQVDDGDANLQQVTRADDGK